MVCKDYEFSLRMVFDRVRHVSTFESLIHHLTFFKYLNINMKVICAVWVSLEFGDSCTPQSNREEQGAF